MSTRGRSPHARNSFVGLPHDDYLTILLTEKLKHNETQYPSFCSNARALYLLWSTFFLQFNDARHA